ncbi:type VI secretion system baseplate subunit TssF [Entomohabitans teleogrylli]|uniref:type VI secretion system baseplate subunit TssF n=1 Tax=Entomohabitans teleogrylli TaxID=1384589 RepID=UPI00073D8B14|nr:type VI secretion system baseplate subunit TssF [Entomohabitans teleogrylli]
MNRKLLEYYNRELSWLREMGAEFASQYPKVAGRLGILENEVTDPYIERLMEGFAFLTSRIQLKMDAEFPRFTRHLLEMIYPGYLAPTPSMAIAELQPDDAKGDISAGFVVPRGTLMESLALKKKGISCCYTTASEVTLHPLRLSDAALGGIPANLTLSTPGNPLSTSVSALRIRLCCFNTVTLKGLQLDELMFYLAGPEREALQLLELVMQHATGVICQTVEPTPRRVLLAENALRQQGFAPEQALLPGDLRNFEGYRLLQEYFAFPARFRFFSVHGLQALFSRCAADKKAPREFEIIILLDKQEPALERLIDASHLALHCTPVINLFPRVADRLSLSEHRHEYHLVVDRIRPLDYEVFSVQRLLGSGRGTRYEQTFLPFYHTGGQESGDHSAWFSLRREPRALSERARQSGARTGYAGSEVYFSLSDSRHAPWHGDLHYLSAEVLCTNRDLPLLLRQQDPGAFVVPDSIPLRQVVFREGPTEPRPALAEDRITWQLISQLQLNYLSLMDRDPQQGAASLRQLLGLYGDLCDPAVARQIDGVRHCRLRPVYQRAPLPGPVAFARGIAIELTLDEQAFSGSSPYVLGCVLEQLFARLVAINAFTRVTLISQQRGEIARWPARMGNRMLI